MTATIEIADLAATEAFGRWLAVKLFPGAVVALIGPLGAGKTHLTRAIAEGLNVRNPAAISSPTFVLIHEYVADLPIYHFDAYRLVSSRDFTELGVEEYFRGDGVCLVEWADRVPDAMPTELLTVTIERIDEQRRRFHITANGLRYEAMLSGTDAPSQDPHITPFAPQLA